MQSCAYIQPIASKPVGCFIIQQDNNPLRKTKKLTRVKRRKILDWPSQLSDWAPFQKVAVAATSSKELKTWAVEDWEIISREVTKHLQLSLSQKLKAVAYKTANMMILCVPE